MRLDLFSICLPALAIACAIAAPAMAQAWPARPVRVIVPFAPGGGVDTVTRLLAQKLTEQTGASFVVENRAGGGGIVGAEFVAKAAPDGYTLLVTSNVLWITPLLQNTPYDPLKDFLPITLATISPNILVVHPSVAAQSVKELIALAKAKPGTLNYASS